MFAISACHRCRARKTRCDPGLPKCGPCQKSASNCEYYDTAKGRRVSRYYIVHLQQRVQKLETELAELKERQQKPPDAEDVLRSGGLVRLKDSDETRYLGPSSGINMTRIIMQMAMANTNAASIQEIISDQKAREIKEKFRDEETKPTSKVYPLVSSVAATGLPSRPLTDKLVEIFNERGKLSSGTRPFKGLTDRSSNNATYAP
ncbi:MAG: hypothetical protein LQ342_001616 [Letrouitia transgressa]|nr:MAG: hypothetical protein LQ342_001616 [Letrouitia transgressa]